jgi:hypothetical protein
MSDFVISVSEPVTSVSVVEDVVAVSVVESPVVVGVQVLGVQGVKGDTGATGATGSQGSSGVVSVTAPITNTGTSTSAVIGVDQSQFVIAQSQVTGLAAALAAEANLDGGNTFTGAQVINTGAVGTIGLQVNTPASPTNHMQVWSLNGSYRSVIDKNGFLSVGGSTALGNITSYAFGASQIPLVLRGAASQSANLQQWQNSAGTVRAFVNASGDFQAPAIVATYSNSVTAGGAAVVPMTVKGAASQTANLQEWQNSAGSVLASMASGGDFFANRVRTLNSAFRGQEGNGGGQVFLQKNTSTPTNPGANFGLVYFRDGTTAGTLKLCVRAGAAGAETTILDNIPQ